jgi:Ca-activated chloride channel family protein
MVGPNVMKRIVPLVFVLLSFGASPARSFEFIDLFLTRDQQAQRLEREGHYAMAAERYEDPFRQGIAWYRAKEFEKAAQAFAHVPTAAAAFNRGNALLLRGQYDPAVTSFTRALELRPGWQEAEENRALAMARKAALAPPDDDAGGTGGALKPDEVVIGDGRRGGTTTQDVDAMAGKPGSDADMRSLWLRQVETKPADFLRAKFAYQRAAADAAVKR